MYLCFPSDAQTSTHTHTHINKHIYEYLKIFSLHKFPVYIELATFRLTPQAKLFVMLLGGCCCCFSFHMLSFRICAFESRDDVHTFRPLSPSHCTRRKYKTNKTHTNTYAQIRHTSTCKRACRRTRNGCACVCVAKQRSDSVSQTNKSNS